MLRFPIPLEWAGELGLGSTDCNSHSWEKGHDVWEFICSEIQTRLE